MSIWKAKATAMGNITRPLKLTTAMPTAMGRFFIPEEKVIAMFFPLGSDFKLIR